MLDMFPFVKRSLGATSILTNDAGEFIFTKHDQKFLTKNHSDKILQNGMGFELVEDIYSLSHQFKTFQRQTQSDQIRYLIIVPTLRCNLNCSYCQVSRVDENKVGYDWDQNTVDAFVKFVDTECSDDLKIEFQGGESLLAIKIIKQIIERVEKLKEQVEFIFCTNLQILPQEFLSLLVKKNIHISTSIDGSSTVHNRNRNQNETSTSTFFNNLNICKDLIGTGRIGALPTITNFGEINDIIDFYIENDFNEIFLRPVNYQGFARKKFKDESNNVSVWIESYLKALTYIFKYNDINEKKIIETNLALHLKRIFRQDENGHVDFRSPNLVAKDYLVIDFNGDFYPSDEARMMTRVGQINLKIGSLNDGFDFEKINTLNQSQNIENNTTCRKCSYKPFCGVDVFDNISRYSRIDVDIHDTYFCKFHISLFDFIFKKIAERDITFLKNVSLHLGSNYTLPHVIEERFID